MAKSGQHKHAYDKPYFFYQKHDSWFGGGNSLSEKMKAVKMAKQRKSK